MLDKKVCIICDVTYAPMTRTQRFCCPDCRKLWENRRSQARWVNDKPRPRQLNGFREFALNPRYVVD